MNKKIVILLTLAALLVVPTVIFAALVIPAQPTDIGGTFDVWSFINNILNIIWPLFIGVSVIMFIIAGFLFIASGGDPGKIATARHAVLYAVIGIIVAISAFSAVAIISNALIPNGGGDAGGGDFGGPQCSTTFPPTCTGECPTGQTCTQNGFSQCGCVPSTGCTPPCTAGHTCVGGNCI